MPTIPAAEFTQNFGKYQDEAQHHPIAVTNHGRIVGAFISTRDLKRYERLMRREQEVLKIGELPEDLLRQIATAEYPAGHEHLDALMDDED
jgi:hypothetical protein